MRILVVEDAKDLADVMVRCLNKLGYAVDWAAKGRKAEELLRQETYQLVILAIPQPGIDGQTLSNTLHRQRGRLPVLAVMRRAPFDDDAERFDWKADDFILKPVDLQELEARCRALLHRYHSAALSKVQFGNLTLDKVAKQVSVEGRPVGLNGREFQLLELLLANPHRAVDKQELMDRLFGVERLATSNALELYISRLRRKLAGASILIRTVRGFGYSAEIQAEPCNLTASGTVATTA